MDYSEKVMDHFANPRNVGVIEDANAVGEVGNAKCGDIMKMYMKINDEGVIEDIKFKTFGCGAAVATSSMATEMVKGKTIVALSFKPEDKPRLTDEFMAKIALEYMTDRLKKSLRICRYAFLTR